jgi:hypothetical protein
MYTLSLIALLWVALAMPVALLIGRGLRIADQRDEAARTSLRVPRLRAGPLAWPHPLAPRRRLRLRSPGAARG